MKKDELIAMGISEEIVKQIMAINGTDIENAKTKATQAADKSQEIENLKNELASNNTKLQEANAQIEKFTGLDIEGIKKEADEWKNKYTEFETKSKADKEAFEKQLQDQQYDFAVKEYVGQYKFANDFVKEAFGNDFKSKGLKYEDGKFLGADDLVKNFMEKNPGVFVTEAATNEPELPQLVAPTGGGKTPVDSGMNFHFTPIHDLPK